MQVPPSQCLPNPRRGNAEARGKGQERAAGVPLLEGFPRSQIAASPGQPQHAGRGEHPRVGSGAGYELGGRWGPSRGPGPTLRVTLSEHRGRVPGVLREGKPPLLVARVPVSPVGRQLRPRGPGGPPPALLTELAAAWTDAEARDRPQGRPGLPLLPLRRQPGRAYLLTRCARKPGSGVPQGPPEAGALGAPRRVWH